MKKEDSGKNSIRNIMEGRAAHVCVVAVSVFLCALTILEFTALEMEWEVPVLQVVSGEHSFWSEEYQREELALDESAENELLEEGTAVGQTGKSGDAEYGEPEEPDESAENVKEKYAGIDEESEGLEKQEKNAAGTEDDGESMGTEQTGNAENTEPDFPYYIRVNRKQNCITIYTIDEHGEYTVPYKAMICSTGLYNATPRGTFQLSTKYLWRELYGGVYGQYATRIYGGVLFHSVPYYKKAKNTLCTDKYNKLGQQASMGCVRLTVEDAKWIAENCPSGTTVEIYDDDDPGPLGKPEAMKLDTDNPNKCWDPTDPDEENPWHELSEDE